MRHTQAHTRPFGRVIGIPNARQTVQALLDEVEHEEQMLVDYVMCVGYR